MTDPGSLLLSGQPLALLFLALAADGLLAGVPVLRDVLALPGWLIGGVTGWFDRRLNRERRSAANRRIRGAVVVILVAGLAGIIGLAIGQSTGSLVHGWAIEGAVVASLIVQRRAVDGARSVGRALRAGQVDAARRALGGQVGYDTAGLDDHAVARGAIESSAVKFCDGVIAPALWYALLGLPALCVYRAVNVMANRIGQPSPRYAAFGTAAARLDRVLNYVPAPLAGAVLSAAALFVPGANMVRAVGAMLRDSRNHPAPSAGWTVGAMAGALRLALSGPRRYGGAVITGPWIGDGRARAIPADIGRAVLLFAVASIMTAGVVAVLALVGAAG